MEENINIIQVASKTASDHQKTFLVGLVSSSFVFILTELRLITAQKNWDQLKKNWDRSKKDLQDLKYNITDH